MVILQLDEPGLFVFDNADQAVRAIEAVDIEKSLRLAYDETGHRLEVSWLEPNRRSSFSPLQTLVNGKYRFDRTSICEPMVLAEILENAEYIVPGGRRAELLALAARLRSRSVRP